MLIGRNLVYATFLTLLLSTLVASQCDLARAEEYAALPASAEETTPLKTGDRVPGFTVRTVNNEPYVFDPDELENPTILISFRGGWCPWCNMHLSELRHVIPQLQQDGYDVLFLSNDRPEALYSSLKLETQEAIEGREYVILSDAEMVAARALGTAFRLDDATIERYDGFGIDYSGSSIDKFRALAVPAVYVINRSGEIVFDFVEPDYKVRLSADDLLSAAKTAL